jgi:hypothetical protein
VIPGFWTVQATSDVEVDIKGPVALNGSSESARGYYHINSPFMVPAICLATSCDALDDLIVNLQPKLKTPNMTPALSGQVGARPPVK